MHIEYLDFGVWILEFGFWILEFGFWSLEFGFWILDFGFCVFGGRVLWMDLAPLEHTIRAFLYY